MGQLDTSARDQDSILPTSSVRSYTNDYCYSVATKDLPRWAELFPVRESSYTQLKSDRFDIQGTVIKAGPVILFQNIVRSASLSHQVPNPSCLAFILPFRWTGEWVFNGRTASPTSLFLSAGPDGYFAHGEARSSIAIGVDRDIFIDTLAALQGVDCEDVAIVGGTFDLAAAEIGALRRLLLGKVNEVRKDSRTVLTADGSFALSDTILLALAKAYLSANPGPGRSRNGGLQSQVIVKKARDLAQAAGNRRISIAELCRATGVGATTLNAAFHEICGGPPLKILKLHRLMEVHNTLLHETPQRAAVKRAAISRGFAEGGRFAAEYQYLFGELPSETLKRSLA